MKAENSEVEKLPEGQERDSWIGSIRVELDSITSRDVYNEINRGEIPQELWSSGEESETYSLHASLGQEAFW